MGIVSRRRRVGIGFFILIANLLLKTNGDTRGGGGMAESGSLIFLFCSLECLNCWQLCDGVVKHKVLFRAGWKHTFRIPGSDNVSPGDGADWVKVTQCVSWELTGKI